jgi:DNA-binding response OmpR family regulator
MEVNRDVQAGDEHEVLTVGPLEVDLGGAVIRIEGRTVGVNGHVFGVLAALARRPGEVVSRDVLYREAWGTPRQPNDRSVDVHIFNLRRRLEQEFPGWSFIRTHHGGGYRLAPQRQTRRQSKPRLRPTRSTEPLERGPDATASDAQIQVPEVSPAPVVVGPVELVAEELLVVVGTKKTWLRPRDMDVLTFLATNVGRVVTRNAIFEAVWQKPLDPQDRSVDVSIRRLRSQLAEAAPSWDFIHTHHGRGYRFEPMPRRSKRRGRPDKLH